MMGLSVAPTPDAISDALSLINVMIDPAQAKRTLEELRDQVAALNKARDEATAEQKRAAAATAEADAAMAKLADREAAVTEREHAVSNREQAFEHAKAVIRSRVAGLDPPPAS
jgi:plasmid stabilization system protein ParE